MLILTVELTKKTPTENENKIQKFEKCSDIALSTIVLLIKRFVRRASHGPDLPKKNLWDVLEQQYKSVSQESRDTLLKTYQVLKMQPE